MQFRVAEFKRIKNGKIFKGFVNRGYYLTNDGKIQHCNKKVSTDKRRNNYVEVNFAIGQKDIKGVELYEKDIVHEHKYNTTGYIEYLPPYGGFFLKRNIGSNMKINFYLLNSREYQFERIGNIYENLHLQTRQSRR